MDLSNGFLLLLVHQLKIYLKMNAPILWPLANAVVVSSHQSTDYGKTVILLRIAERIRRPVELLLMVRNAATHLVHKDRNYMKIIMQMNKCVVSIGIAIVLSVCSALADPMDSGLTGGDSATGNEIAPKSTCCGGTGKKWTYSRMVDGVVVDQGWLIPAKGRWVYDAVPSNSGGLLYLAAVILPLEEGARFPTFYPDVVYYDGQIPGLGRIMAMQHQPGESWEFEYQGYKVIDGEGYTIGSSSFKVCSSLESRWDESWDVQVSNGAWVATSCSNQIDFVYGSPGMQWEELDPEIRELGFIEVEMPVELGHFYGRCHEIGEVWTVAVAGQEFQVTVTEKDPSAIPLDKIADTE
jgi:hypothetical protein